MKVTEIVKLRKTTKAALYLSTMFKYKLSEITRLFVSAQFSEING